MIDSGFLSKAFLPTDADQAVLTFQRLKKHLPSFVLTGGIASAYYFSKYNFPFNQRLLSDLDIVIDDPSDLLSSVTQDFLVAHYHPRNHKGKFHIMLVDPTTKIRIDVFPFLSQAKERTQSIKIGEKNFSVLSLEDLVCRLLSNCINVIEDKEVDPKYFVTMLSLYGACDKAAIREIWEEYRKEGQSFEVTYYSVVDKIKNSPQLLQKIVYSQDLGHTCKECNPISGIALAINQRVYDLLGYV